MSIDILSKKLCIILYGEKNERDATVNYGIDGYKFTKKLLI